MPTEQFLNQTAALRSLGGQRVWSLMLSLFGDLAQDEGQVIDGPLLSAIMQGLDVKPEATRVALHRLRKDEWLRSEKSGRISKHSLTEEGRAQCAAANPRIYADPNGMSQDWQIAILPEALAEMDTTPGADHFAMISPRVFVGPRSAAPPQGALTVPGNTAPAWLIEQAEPSQLSSSYAELLETLIALQGELSKDQVLQPLDIAILRCLIVHNWRRLVLKHPMLPAPLVDPAAPAHQCHRAVWNLLNRFARPALSDLEKHRSAA